MIVPFHVVLLVSLLVIWILIALIQAAEQIANEMTYEDRQNIKRGHVSTVYLVFGCFALNLIGRFLLLPFWLISWPLGWGLHLLFKPRYKPWTED